MEKNRMYGFMIYKIFEKYSDEDHPLNSAKILEYLKQDYDVDMNRGTLRNHVNALSDFGVEITNSEHAADGKYLLDRRFEKSEVYLLSNAIHSAHFIPKKNANELIDKLLESQSIYLKKQFHNTVHIENPRKTNNRDFFYNIETILQAIDQKIAISFSYMRYDIHKKLVKRNDKQHIVYPYYIVTENDNTYLLCKHIHHLEKIIHYRIDKISDIQLISDKKSPLLQESFDPYQYTSTKPFMFSGDTQRIILRCHNSILDDIIDQFGHDLMPMPNKDHETFDVKVNSSAQGIIYFALQYTKFCEVLEPKEIRNEIKEILKASLQQYEKS